MTIEERVETTKLIKTATNETLLSYLKSIFQSLQKDPWDLSKLEIEEEIKEEILRRMEK